MNSIVLTGGGTAGHITPLLALIPYLKGSFDKIYYVGSGKDIEKKLISGQDIQPFFVPSPPFKRSLAPSNLLIPIRLLRAVKRCKEFLISVKPQVVFSKGGYCALPLCIAANQLNIPVVCHESDLSLGLANKLTYKKSTLLTTFEHTAKKYNGVLVGAPIRKNNLTLSKESAQKKLGIKANKPVLLVTGGSQGSKTINYAIWNNLNEILTHFNVIHLYGRNNKCPYNTVNGYLALDFGDMFTCITACDIALSRGGSNTIFELLNAKIPTMVLPLKRGSRGDQIKNAKYFAQKNLLLYCDEQQFIKSPLENLLFLLNQKSFLTQNLSQFKITNATPKIAKILTNYCKKN